MRGLILAILPTLLSSIICPLVEILIGSLAGIVLVALMDLRARVQNTNGVSIEHLTKMLCRFPDSKECDRLVASACKKYFDCQKSSAGKNTRRRTATGS
ncbi:hypothetical protein L873DRAFT_1806753 [Choiromyces venosus 120613-1]|uniref:Uncharacterized protein n=1 Tax=Choiromyces venosus 120613-1 TaxID=1336337 RepID=A0A3N4JLZ6_9PEZI|nr:hypothetical protein L873DRAFT_1806753 [Choiromyces venosus 120613-1]